VAKLGKDKHFLLHHGNGIIGTDLGTLATIGAFPLIYLWNRDGDLLLVTKQWLKQNVSIGLFYIAVNELYAFFTF